MSGLHNPSAPAYHEITCIRVTLMSNEHWYLNFGFGSILSLAFLAFISCSCFHVCLDLVFLVHIPSILVFVLHRLFALASASDSNLWHYDNKNIWWNNLKNFINNNLKISIYNSSYSSYVCTPPYKFKHHPLDCDI